MSSEPSVFAPAIRSRAAARAIEQAPAAPVQQVYAPGFALLLSLPASCIVQMPPAKLNITRLVLCSKFSVADPEASCPMGDKCKFVHADASAATAQHEVHVNYAWRCADDVTYPRLPSGGLLRIAPAKTTNESNLPAHLLQQLPSENVPSEHVLRTKAFDEDGHSSHEELQHCAHFRLSRTCNHGADCKFVHMVHIDASAKDHQRAPSMKDTRHGRKASSSAKKTSDDCLGKAAEATTVNLLNSQPSTAPSTPPSPCVAAMPLCGEFELGGGGCLGSSAATPSTPSRLFRHDPYKASYVPGYGAHQVARILVGW